MNEKETREILDNMSEQEFNDFIFFALKEVEKENQKLKTELKKKDKIIDLMAEQLAGLAIFDIDKDEPLILGDKEEIKQYFKEKEEDGTSIKK